MSKKHKDRAAPAAAAPAGKEPDVGAPAAPEAPKLAEFAENDLVTDGVTVGICESIYEGRRAFVFRPLFRMSGDVPEPLSAVSPSCDKLAAGFSVFSY